MRALRERTDGIQTKGAIRQEALRLFLRNGGRGGGGDVSNDDLLTGYWLTRGRPHQKTNGR